MSKVLRILASPMLMAMLIIAFGVACAIATFIENDFGTQSARALVYEAWWFELIMLLLAVNFIASIYSRKLYQKSKLPIMIFHVGFVVILLGAAVTRYIGQEGMMHIREGEKASSFESSDRWLSICFDDEIHYDSKKGFTPVSRNNFSRKIKHKGRDFTIELTDYVPNAQENVVEHPNGYPVVSLVITDDSGSHPALVRPGKILPVGITGLGFNGTPKELDVELMLTDTGMVARSPYPVTIRQMPVEEEGIIEPKNWFKLTTHTFYHAGNVRFAYRGHWRSAKVKMVYSPEPDVQGTDVLRFNVNTSKSSAELFVPISKADNEPVYEEIDGVDIGIRYGTKDIPIPFDIKLNEFVLERYPGSESPSSFISHVTVLDNEIESEKEKAYSIYMNNILNYRGYRFYQSSYDPDEKGTYLSVNKDFWGTAITYFGYFILIVGVLWSLFAPGTRFRKLISKSATPVVLSAFLLISPSVFSQDSPVPSVKHAKEFGTMLTQDQGGRVKPISTLSGEVLRKLNRSTKFQGHIPEQVFLGMSAFPDFWQHVPIIKVKDKELKALLGIRDDMAAFVDFFDHQQGSTYKLRQIVQEAIALKPAQRGSLQKEVVKVDERVNILYMIFSGQLARIFPITDHPENRWLSMSEASESNDTLNVELISDMYARYIVSVRNASESEEWGKASSMLHQIIDYQREHGKDVVPSATKVKSEVLSNRLLIFERLIPIYGITGLMLLIFVFFEFFRKTRVGNKFYVILSVALFAGFLLHTFGIGLRWYIAGRAPLSNGFESMVYVAWAAMLAGFVFAKRSRVVLPATALLSTLTLFVAHLSWMDPEITNLVPVLKSYWLTIHVAVITASYGFFGLGAILGLFNIVLYAFKTNSNKINLNRHISSITNINELNLTLGLYLLTIGSFLGAVWANESWGRYWGWDPKETWALITILVYAFILHMRLIPSVKSAFAFNFGALIGISSVLMTYFGVNYYLSGLHSYAGGDPIPVPSWIFFIVAAILSLSFFAWYNNRLVEEKDEKRETTS